MIYHAEHVGSLLRPSDLLAARAAFASGTLDRDGLRAPVLESQDELRRRVDEAARYVPLDNLALSPQCGFASTAAGNLLTRDDQRRKLELVVDTAAKIWE